MNRFCLEVSLLICALAFSGAVWAQDNSFATAQNAESRKTNTLIEEIIVTAQKREQAVSDVPIAIQAFSGDSLKVLGVSSTKDLANLIPAFSVGESGFDNPIYTLRGVGFDDSSRTANSTVGVYVDQAPIPYAYMTQGSDIDLHRVEVLKGPQGTLYGKNTTGGAINYVSNKPTEDFEASIGGEYSRYETYRAEGYVSGPLTDQLGGRIAVLGEFSSEGWQESITRNNDRLGKKEKYAARVSLLWRESEEVDVLFSLNFWRDLSDPQAPQPIEIISQNANLPTAAINPLVVGHPLARKNTEEADWDPDIDWRLDSTFLMPVISVSWEFLQSVNANLIASYVDFETDNSALPLSGLSVTNNEIKRRNTDASSYSLEFRLEGFALSDRLSWLTGVFVSNDKVFDDNILITETNSAVFNIVPGVYPIADHSQNSGDQKAESNAAFANVDFRLGEAFELTFGARYSDDTRRYEGCTSDAENDNNGLSGVGTLIATLSLAQGGSGIVEYGDCFALDKETRDPGPIRSTLSEDSLSGKAAITWTPRDEHLFYFSYSRGFKAGSFPIVSATDGIQYDPAVQEQLDSFEIGGKTIWLDGSIKMNFAAFSYDYQDKQLLSFFVDPLFGPLPRLFNAPSSKVQGLELELQSNPYAGLYIAIAASYLDTEVEEFVGTTSDGEEDVDFSGADLPFAPSFESSLVVNYNFDVMESLEGKVSLNYSYVGEATSELEQNPVFEIPDYSLLSARFSLSPYDMQWEAAVWGRNIMDEFYQLSVPQLAADTRIRYTGMPRTYGVSVTYNFF